MKEVKIEGAKLKDLTDAARVAGAGVDDGFWGDVNDQIERAEEASKIPVEPRLTRPRE